MPFELAIAKYVLLSAIDSDLIPISGHMFSIFLGFDSLFRSYVIS